MANVNTNAVAKQQSNVIDYTNIYRDMTSFEAACRMAGTLSKSTVIPKEYQNNPSNTLIALEMSQRLRTSPLMVMQSLYIVNGKPGWSSQFIIASINSSGKYSRDLQFELSGKGDNLSCYAWTIDLEGNKICGPVVTIDMAKKEGWYDKNGSKWKTMPEIMIRYRAASFFGKSYCPDMLLGIGSKEEVIDIVDYEVISPEQEVEQEIHENANKQTVNFDEVEAEDIPQETEEQAEYEVKEKEQPEPDIGAEMGIDPDPGF